MRLLDSFIENNKRITTVDLNTILNPDHWGVKWLAWAIQLFHWVAPYLLLWHLGLLKAHWAVLLAPFWTHALIYVAIYASVYQAVKPRE